MSILPSSVKCVICTIFALITNCAHDWFTSNLQSWCSEGIKLFHNLLFFLQDEPQDPAVQKSDKTMKTILYDINSQLNICAVGLLECFTAEQINRKKNLIDIQFHFNLFKYFYANFRLKKSSKFQIFFELLSPI